MILELIEYLATPCPKAFRSIGFLSSAMEVRARYRRCRQAWLPHIDKTRRTILEAANLCTARRKVVVLGAGLLHDIPLKELSASFKKVVLVDIVHPSSSRLAALRFKNVEQVSADVTEVMERLLSVSGIPEGPLPISQPKRFIGDTELDLALSVNLLSQLSHVPGKYLTGRRSEATIDAFSKHLIEAHLNYLCRLPSRAALITDLAVRRVNREKNEIEEWDALYGAKLPEPDYSWEWSLAPSPEVARGIDISTTVAAYTDWKKACGR